MLSFYQRQLLHFVAFRAVFLTQQEFKTKKFVLIPRFFRFLITLFEASCIDSSWSPLWWNIKGDGRDQDERDGATRINNIQQLFPSLATLFTDFVSVEIFQPTLLPFLPDGKERSNFTAGTRFDPWLCLAGQVKVSCTDGGSKTCISSFPNCSTEIRGWRKIFFSSQPRTRHLNLPFFKASNSCAPEVPLRTTSWPWSAREQPSAGACQGKGKGGTGSNGAALRDLAPH